MRKPVALVLAILFVLFAAVQYNDPDPQVWVPIYVVAALACGLVYRGLGQWWWFAGLALVYAVAAWSQWPPVFEGLWLNQVGMKTPNVELARESGGLLICAAAMAWLGYSARR